MELKLPGCDGELVFVVGNFFMEQEQISCVIIFNFPVATIYTAFRMNWMEHISITVGFGKVS